MLVISNDHEGERRFKIRDVTAEEVGKEKKLIVWFTNDEKGLVLNKTNNRVLREKFGDDVAGWIGKIIVVFSTMVLFQGRMTPGLRVRIPPPKQQQPSTKPASSTTIMSRGEETQPLGSNGPVAAKSGNNKKPATKKKPQTQVDEHDEIIPPLESGDDDLNDDIDMVASSTKFSPATVSPVHPKPHFWEGIMENPNSNKNTPTTYQKDLAKLPRALVPLIERPQWCVWRWTPQKSRWQKPPFMAKQPERHASTDNPATWCEYKTALATVQAGDADGITYMLTEDDPFAAIDLDHCRDARLCSIDIWAQNFLDTARYSYAEVTPSGTGCRIWGLATGDPVNESSR